MSPSQDESCFDLVAKSSGLAYVPIAAKQNHSEATETCSSLGAHLPMARSSKEMEALLSVLEGGELLLLLLLLMSA